MERIATHVVAQTLAYLPLNEVNDQNAVKLTGVVKQTWTAKKDLLARLDVYDRETPVVGESTQLPGAAHRRAHHVIVKFIEGKTLDGRLAKIARGDRILVTGYIQHAQYSEGLNKLLLKARQPERIIDGDDGRRVSRESTFVVAETMVRFSARPKSVT